SQSAHQHITSTASPLSLQEENNLTERMISGLKEMHTKIVNELLNSAAGSYLYHDLKDIIAFEIDGIEKLITFRIQSIKTMILSAYAYIVHLELHNKGSNIEIIESAYLMTI